MNRNDVNRKTWYLLILMPIIYLAVSVLVVFLVKNNGAYPTGSDTMYHIFRGDYVYNSIKEGSLEPEEGLLEIKRPSLFLIFSW